MKMTTYILLIMITISFAQYNLVWQVDQDYYESGHILFDVNDDDVVDLTKQYGPYITVYDGSDNYSIIWSLNNLDFEYNTLYQELDINTDGSSEFIVVSSDIWTQNRFQVHLYQNLDTEPMWSSPIFEGYLSGTDSFDLLGDGNKNILIGSVNSTDSDYSSSIVLLNGSTGEILWNEPDIDGYITGPYSGDLDGDGKTEILYNQYHQTSETYQLISSEISIEWCGSGDINEDTMLDILDIVALVTCIMDGCNFEDFPCCDITNDQSIDILDIVLMIDRILGEWFYQNLTIIEEWQVDQNQYESGHLSFDINLDGYPELTKTLFNTVTIYNAVNNYQVDWSFLDEESDYLSLQIFDQELFEGFEGGIFLRETVTSDTLFHISLQLPADNTPQWDSDTWDGYITRVQLYQEPESETGLFFLGVNEYIESTDNYVSRIVVLNTDDGSIQWQSEEYSGYIIGPYAGNINGDGNTNILVNIFDTVSEASSLLLYEYSEVATQSDNSVPVFYSPENKQKIQVNLPSSCSSDAAFQNLKGIFPVGN